MKVVSVSVDSSKLLSSHFLLLVVHLTTPWGFSQYQVLGATTTYTVFPAVSGTSNNAMAYCTCPSFTYTVLLSDKQIMVCICTRQLIPAQLMLSQCKHMLAIILALRLSRCTERRVGPDELAVLAQSQTKAI